MGRRKSSPKFISARVRTGDGQAQEFADIHFGMGQDRRWATEMNVGQPAGRRGRRRRWVTEMNFGQRAGRRVWTGDGQAQEFADIHFGMGLRRRWETEMMVFE
jgi:hypothetical protein